jgi:uncharacterized membrane protein (UPF0182 family)
LDFSLIVLKLILLANHIIFYLHQEFYQEIDFQIIYFNIIIQIIILMGIYRNNSTVFGTLSLATNDGSDEI